MLKVGVPGTNCCSHNWAHNRQNSPELLPGLEEFLTVTLSSENLSNFAEERRQFFIERLDIIKLPPSLPPREGRALPPELLKETEEISGIPANQHTANDFAATQREISRSFCDSNILPEDVVDEVELSSCKVIKVYDDIDSTDSSNVQSDATRPHASSGIRTHGYSDDDDGEEDNEENALYEIPVARQQLSPEGNSQSLLAAGSSTTNADSVEELQDDVLDSALIPSSSSVPPPLPPRREIKFSDSGSHNSINFDDRPPELPFRPPLPKRNELNMHSEKSDPSEKSNNSDLELSGDGESTSYESFEEGEQLDTGVMNKLNIQLPKKPNKRIGLKKSKTLRKSQSSSQWEITMPFRKLENIDISGELYYKGKLKWNRRIVAISNGCLAIYKPDKEARPSLVIPLTGYEAYVNEREGRRGFEIKMVHPNIDSHTFSVDFKEWALLWVEHINGTAKGQTVAKYHTHLARSLPGDGDCGAAVTGYGSKMNVSEKKQTAEFQFGEIDFEDDLTGNIIVRDEGDCASIKSSPIELLSRKINRTLAAKHFPSEKSPRHSKSRVFVDSANTSPLGARARDRTISSAVKDILRRRQKAVYRIQEPEPCVQMERYTPKGDSSSSYQGQLTQAVKTAKSVVPATSLSLEKIWGWKSVLYSWSVPLDQLILAFRRTDLNESSSNLSTGSEGGSEDTLKSKTKGNKVKRMGSIAFRATQFFENFGKKATHKKRPHHDPCSNFRHSGDFTDVHSGIVEESSVPTSRSTGNLAKSRAANYPDCSSSSMLIRSESALPLSPKQQSEETEHEDHLFHVTIKGYLLIFSSYNKRCWGKRWCLVRQNMFECYKSENSKLCELNFHLKQCEVHRAVAETNSERGLMILDAGREKITVEPLSKEEMGQWVRVLINETSTKNVPEGLEEYMKDPVHSDGDSISLISFSVLKQWDMDCLVPSKNSSSHDYEDPDETTDMAKNIHIHSHPESFSSQANTSLESRSSRTNTSRSVVMLEHVSNKVKDNLSTFKTHKHTTDSGFYSSKGDNSDSDSCQEDCESEEKESNHMYSAQCQVAFMNVTSSRVIDTNICENKKNSLVETFSHDACLQCHRLTAPSHCACLCHSSSLSSPAVTREKSRVVNPVSHVHIARSTSDMQHTDGNINLDNMPLPENNTSLLKPDNSINSSLTMLSPGGEVYTMVLKHSQRPLKSSKSDIDQLSNDSCDDKDVNDVNCSKHISEMHTTSLAASNSDTYYYEPISTTNIIASCRTSAEVELNKLGNDASNTLNGVSQSDSVNQLPAVPTSPVPHLLLSSSHSSSTKPEARTQSSEKSILKQSNVWPQTRKNCDLSRLYTINSENNGAGNAKLSDVTHLPEEKEDISLLQAESSFGDVHFYTCGNFTTSDVIITLINNPDTTASQLRDMIVSLKHEQSEINRKRLAVNAKYHSLPMNEEKVVFENELAALDRTSSAVEHDMKIVQNYLERIQAQPNETNKTSNGKHKSKSKIKKLKKITKVSSG